MSCGELLQRICGHLKSTVDSQPKDNSSTKQTESSGNRFPSLRAIEPSLVPGYDYFFLGFPAYLCLCSQRDGSKSLCWEEIH